MSFHIHIEGVVGELAAEVHDAIHALTKDFMDGLHKLEGVKVESAAVSTPTKSANVAHDQAAAAPIQVEAVPPAAPAGGGSAEVSGTDLATGDHIHPNTPGSPPKGTK